MNTFNLSYKINGNKRFARNLDTATFDEAATEVKAHFLSKGLEIKDIRFEGEFNGQHRVA